MRLLRQLRLAIVIAIIALFAAIPGCSDRRERSTVYVPEYRDGGVYVDTYGYYHGGNVRYVRYHYYHDPYAHHEHYEHYGHYGHYGHHH
jgi:hypothetical protein